ncbi:MAG: helix-turn-helix transcriptional regulator [Clostridia bacterium]|nr:helix-turn-helix transcriptional regulator [Clostridia bacterium]
MKNAINNKIIYDFMKKENLTKTQFCKKCNISLFTFNKLVSQQTNFSLTTIFKIARVMNVSIKDFFE